MFTARYELSLYNIELSIPQMLTTHPHIHVLPSRKTFQKATLSLTWGAFTSLAFEELSASKRQLLREMVGREPTGIIYIIINIERFFKL